MINKLIVKEHSNGMKPNNIIEDYITLRGITFKSGGHLATFINKCCIIYSSAIGLKYAIED